MPKLSFSELKHAFQNQSNKLAVVTTAVVLGATQSQAALAIDTTGIVADIGVAGAAGLVIALGVAGVAIGVGLVKKLIRA